MLTSDQDRSGMYSAASPAAAPAAQLCEALLPERDELIAAAAVAQERRMSSAYPTASPAPAPAWIAASSELQAWWSQDELAALAARVESAWQAWCTDWGVPPGRVDAYNAAQPPRDAAGPGEWQALGAVTAGAAWIAFTTGEPAAVIGTLLFGHMPQAMASQDSLAREVAGKAVQALAAVLGEALRADGGVPVKPTGRTSAIGAPPQRDSRPWSGAVRVLARFGDGAHRGVWLHLSLECTAALQPNDRSLKCREPLCFNAGNAALTSGPCDVLASFSTVP